jgi:ABC-type polysaccharide/polyol phosphate export permease
MFLIAIAIVVASIFGFVPNFLTVIYIVFCSIVFIIALTRFTSALTTVVPDFAQLLNILMQLFMWFTPIIWNLTMLSDSWSEFFKAFPFTYLVEGFRQAFMSDSTIITESNGKYTIIFWVITLVLFIWGNSVFKKTKKDFADVL